MSIDNARTPVDKTGPRVAFHAVRFYTDETSLARMVAEFFAEGLAAGDPALVIATPEHRDMILSELRARGLDVVALQRAGELLAMDAHDTLAQFMRDGAPDVGLFKRVTLDAIDRVCRGRRCTVRIFGEMVNLLWKDGLEAAAIRLEALWNELANTREFQLLCGYSMGSFYKGAAIERICSHHTHRAADDGETAIR